MNYHEKLDSVLLTLSKIDDPYHKNTYEVNSKLKEKLSDLDIELILEHLVLIGFASEHEKVANYGKFLKSYNNYRITIQGLLFLEKSSFKSEINKGKRMAIWTVAKTIAAIANACIIIIIGIASVYVSKQSNQKDEEIKVLNLKIDSLKTVKNSFYIDSTNRTENKNYR